MRYAVVVEKARANFSAYVPTFRAVLPPPRPSRKSWS